MPKVVLSFTLPQEQKEFELAKKAGDFMSCLYNIVSQLRIWRKYENKQYISIEELENYIWNLIREHDIDPYEI